MATDRDPAPFSLSGITLPSGVFVMEVRGDLDLFTASRVRVMLERALNANARGVVVDLYGIESIDSSGLAAFVMAQRRLAKRSEQLTLVTGDENLLARIRMAGLDRVFNVVPSRDDVPGAVW
jgi:anti-sigma B factor antagonist